MNKENPLGLYEHNRESYEKIKEAFRRGEKVVGIVHATGTGKTYNALQLALDHPDKKITLIAPHNSILEHIEEIIKENNLSLERDFPNLTLMNYQGLVNLSREELALLPMDILILDEFHHIGAPVWGERVNELIKTHSNLDILGMSAYTVRDRGTIYERDMANPDGGELFSEKVVSRYDVANAMLDGVLPSLIYRSGYIKFMGTLEALEEKVKVRKCSKEEKELYDKLLKDVKRRIEKALSLSDMIEKYVGKEDKLIYFCPPGSNIEEIEEEAKKWFLRYIPESDIVFYKTTSAMGDVGVKNRDAFYHDKTLDGIDATHKLRVMFCINQYNEGVHAPNVNGVIMGRETKSDIVFFEQLGRALSVRGDTKAKFLEYQKYSREELIKLCQSKNITVYEDMSNERMIEKLIAPYVIDLTNNIGFIKELENNLKNKAKERQEKGDGKKRILNIQDVSFDIEIANEEIYEILKYVSDRLTMTWEDWYDLAKTYYEYHGNLNVPQNFKTINGYEYDENGLNLSRWISKQRTYKKEGTLSQEREEELVAIGMIFDVHEMQWQEMYELAKKYYEHYNNLNVPRNFKTINGYEYNEKGIALGSWISKQRTYKKEGTLSQEREEELVAIGMIFDVHEMQWQEMYSLAKTYYEYHGNLDASFNFKTINGYEYDEKGIALGSWIGTQRNAKKLGTLSKARENMLLAIGMIFDVFDVKWQEMYSLAKTYYEHHDNLNVPNRFKTINGYEYDEKGIALGSWIGTQRLAKKNGTLSQEREEKLLAIGMIFNTLDVKWQEMYSLAKTYYEHHDNLNVPNRFKTINGYEYDEKGIALGSWIGTQRLAKKNGTLSQEREEKLLAIGMIFNTLDIQWQEMYDLAQKYYEHYDNLNVPRNFKTTNGYEYDEQGLNLGSWIHTQKTSKKQGTLSQGREEKLLAIGMIFDIRKNKSLVQELCQNYGIDEKKNKAILKGIPYREMVAKIKYLEEKEIAITNDGYLHEIFDLSNGQLQEKYGIRFEELVNTCLLEEKRGR